MFGVSGLLYIPHYISQPHHDFLFETIDAQSWRGDLARRTQHYGYVYDYRAKSVDAASRLGDLPAWLQRIAVQLVADGLMPKAPDQAIINEYAPGQGIASHIDCVPCFDDVVISLSLAAAVVMDLKQKENHVPLLLEPRSLLLLRSEARYHWTHGIAKRQQDTVNGTSFPRERRLSITFRNVILAS
jgi:alkylated DNA repair dioxygenase AlkB